MSLDPERVYVHQAMEGSETHALPQGEVTLFSAKCPHAERPNEDAAAILPLPGDRLVLAVADGVGGNPAGGEAAQFALQAITEAVLGADDQASLTSVMVSAFDLANRRVRAMGIGAATTLAAVGVEGGLLRSYHAGDSAVMIIGQRGRLRHETVPHSPTGYAMEAGLMDEHEALGHEERHLVTNLVGSEDMRIEIGPPIRLGRFDTVVLGTDGLFDNVRLDEVVETVRKGPLQLASDRLAEMAGKRMLVGDGEHPHKPDDLTFILYRGGKRPSRPGIQLKLL